jgi:hypothetical protein
MVDEQTKFWQGDFGNDYTARKNNKIKGDV